MKKVFPKRKLSIVAATLLFTVSVISVLFYACTKPTEGINIIVNSQALFPAPTLVKFINADSTSANKPGNFAVNITGPGAKYVQLNSGGTNFKTNSGLLSLSLTKDANPSVTNPIIFTVSATIPGFAPMTKNISLTKNDLSVILVKAVEYTRPPAGTTVVNGIVTPLNAGTLPIAYTLTTAKTGTMNEQATITFAAGTQMLDANGTVINGSALTLYIVQYGTTTDASLQAFPGGFVAPVAFKTDGSQIAGGVNFVTAGLLQINLYVNGVAVKKLSKPATVSIELNNNLSNFSTGTTIQTGHVIPVWSMDEVSGQWVNEGSSTVILDNNNRKSASFLISHLSSWNLDWTWGTSDAYGTCGSQLSVAINPSDPTFSGGPYDISLQTPSGQYLCGLSGVNISKGYIATFPFVPNISQAKIVVSGGIPYTRVQSQVFTPCSAGTVAITVPIPVVEMVNVSLSIKGICTSKNITVLPTSTFELYQQTSTQGQNTPVFTDAGTIPVTNGKGSTTLQVGKQYYFVTNYNGTEYKTDPFSVIKGDIAIPSTTSTLSASAIYSSSTNTLNINGTIPINCN